MGMKDEREKKLKAELERIVSRLPDLDIERAILIGSMALGKVHKGSDVDIILVKKPKRSSWRGSKRCVRRSNRGWH